MSQWSVFTLKIVLTFVTTQYIYVSTFNIIKTCSHNVSFTSSPPIPWPYWIISYQLLLYLVHLISSLCVYNRVCIFIIHVCVCVCTCSLASLSLHEFECILKFHIQPILSFYTEGGHAQTPCTRVLPFKAHVHYA